MGDPRVLAGKERHLAVLEVARSGVPNILPITSISPVFSCEIASP